MASSADADRALRDLRDIVVRSTIWSSLANADIRSKYRLSTFGSLWITLTTGAMALAIGLFHGQFFGQDMHSYLPYFNASFITWTFIASVLGEASLTLLGAGSLIKSSQMPIVFHVLRMLHRNLIVFPHNAIVLIVIWPFVRWPLYPSAVLSVAGVVDRLFIADALQRMNPNWPFEARVHDMLKGPVSGNFDAAYALDVLGHMKPEDEHQFLRSRRDWIDRRNSDIFPPADPEKGKAGRPFSNRRPHISELRALDPGWHPARISARSRRDFSPCNLPFGP